MKILNNRIHRFLGLLCVLFLCSNSYGTPIVKLVEPININVGSAFNVEVIVDGVTDFDIIFGSDELIAFGFDVSSSPGLTFNGATIGSDFIDNSNLFSETDVAGHAFPGVIGNDILLAALSFTPTVSGTFSLGITSDIFDPNEGMFTLFHHNDMTTNLSIDVSEPSSLILLIIGLTLFLSKRKRRISRSIYL